MKITILHNAVAESDSLAERDVLVQVAAVEQALSNLGHSTRRLPCTLNLELVEEALIDDRPDIVFNLVESLGSSDRLAHLAPALLEDLDLPFTGNSSTAIHATNNKSLTKQQLRTAGLPTPAWTTTDSLSTDPFPPPYIIKAIWEHASAGLDDHAIVRGGDGSLVREQIESRARQLGQRCFAEQFISGREFNLSVIAASEGPRVLPPAEIDFSAFPEGKPRIVGYAAKWDEDTFEFANTPRIFDFTDTDAPLLDSLRTLALACWGMFHLAGYARIDFRVDDQGQPWILEINTNPCLSEGAGFAAALARADLSLNRAIEWLLEDALRPKDRCESATAIAPMENASSQHSVLSTQYPVLPPPTTDAERRAKKPRRATTTKLRTEVQPTDSGDIRRLVAASNLFREAEIDVAVELVDTRREKGPASGYEFAFAEQKNKVVGYICFGKNTLTVSSFDIYWIAVDPAKQGQGIGRTLLGEAEQHIAAAGGTRIYIETSHRADYQATRGFYDRCGYTLAAVLDDFYAPNDSKAVYVKRIDPV